MPAVLIDRRPPVGQRDAGCDHNTPIPIAQAKAQPGALFGVGKRLLQRREEGLDILSGLPQPGDQSLRQIGRALGRCGLPGAPGPAPGSTQRAAIPSTTGIEAIDRVAATYQEPASGSQVRRQLGDAEFIAHTLVSLSWPAGACAAVCFGRRLARLVPLPGSNASTCLPPTGERSSRRWSARASPRRASSTVQETGAGGESRIVARSGSSPNTAHMIVSYSSNPVRLSGARSDASEQASSISTAVGIVRSPPARVRPISSARCDSYRRAAPAHEDCGSAPGSPERALRSAARRAVGACLVASWTAAAARWSGIKSTRRQ